MWYGVVCVCARAYERACVCMRVVVCVRMFVCVRACYVCVYQACAHESVCLSIHLFF